MNGDGPSALQYDHVPGLFIGTNPNWKCASPFLDMFL